MGLLNSFLRLFVGVFLLTEIGTASAMCEWVCAGDTSYIQALRKRVLDVKFLQSPEGGMKTWNGEEIDLSCNRNVLCFVEGGSLISGISPFGTNDRFRENNVFTFFDMFVGASQKKELDSSLLKCDIWLKNAVKVIAGINKNNDKKLLSLLRVFSPEIYNVFFSNCQKSGLPLDLLDAGCSIVSIDTFSRLNDYLFRHSNEDEEVCNFKDREIIAEFLNNLNVKDLDTVKRKEKEVLSLLLCYCDRLLPYIDFLESMKLGDIIKEETRQNALEESKQALLLIKAALLSPDVSYLSAIHLFEDGEIIRCTLNCFHTELLLAFLLASRDDQYAEENKQLIEGIKEQLCRDGVVFCTYNDMCNVCEPFIRRIFTKGIVYVYSIEEHTGSENRHSEDSNVKKIALGTRFCWKIFNKQFSSFLKVDRSKEEFHPFSSLSDFISYCKKYEHTTPARQLIAVLKYIDSPRFSISVGNRAEQLLGEFLGYVNASISSDNREIVDAGNFEKVITGMQKLFYE